MSEKLHISDELDAGSQISSFDFSSDAALEADQECTRQALRAMGGNPALAFLLDSLREGVAVIRAEDGHLEWANRAFLEGRDKDFERVTTRGCLERWKGETEGCQRCP